jgi:hypothetical protein
MRVKSLTIAGLFAILLTGFLVACGDNEASSSTNTTPPTGNDVATEFSADLQVVGSLDDLEGRLLFIEERGQPNFRVGELHFPSGEISTLFKAPENSWIYQVAESSLGDVVISYSAPAESGAAILDRRGIYQLNGIGTENVVADALVPATKEDEVLAYPAWGPNGRILYYAEVVPNPKLRGAFIMRMIRYIVSSDDREQILPMALLPAVSPNGEEVAYITVNPLTTVRSLFKADSFGDKPKMLILEFDFPDLDTPKYSQDGEWIYFIGLEDPNQQQGFLENLLFGVPAYAHENHEVPADWWRVPASGGEPERLTEIRLIIHDGAFSPDGKQFIFSTSEGLYGMNADGSNLRHLVKSRAIKDIDWVE